MGTRPEIIRLSRIMALCDAMFDHTIIHTGQNYDYELSDVFWNELGIRKPDLFLSVAADQVAETISNIIWKSDQCFAQVSPDALLILGDTNSCLCALAAKRRKIPIFHMEAGNRCFDMRVPEEINRKMVDHLADVNMPYSEAARHNLLSEGLSPKFVFKTGSPMREVIEFHRESIEASDILTRVNLLPQEYYVFSCHREENVDSEVSLRKVIAFLYSLRAEFEKPIVFSVHPRTSKRLKKLGFSSFEGLVMMKPLGFFDYIKLQKNSAGVISDSGTITEEAAILGFPAINFRENQERFEGLESGVVPLVGLDSKRAIQALKSFSVSRVPPPSIPLDYQSTDVSRRVVKLILSYVDVVNRDIWRKSE